LAARGRGAAPPGAAGPFASLERPGPWTWLALLLGAALLLRLPIFFYPFFNGDEATYSALANALLSGRPLYLGAVDHKPPLIATTYALILGAAGAQALWAVHAASIAVVALTAAVLGGVARALGRSLREARLAGLLYLALAGLGPGKDMLAANAELFMLLPSTAAALAFLRARNASGARYWLLLCGAGALGGLAFLYKYQGGAVLGTLVFFAAYEALLSRKWARGALQAVALGAGALAPVALLVAIYAALGGLNDLAFWAWRYPLQYAGKLPPAGVLGNALRMVPLWGAPNLIPAAAAVLGWRWLRRSRRSAGDGATAYFALVWLFWATTGVLAGGRFFLHYFLQLAPPLALLASVGALAPWGVAERRQRWLRRGAVAGLLLTLLGFWGANAADHALRPRVARYTALYREIGTWVRAHSQATDRLLVWGNSPEIYHFAARRMGTRFVFCNYHSGKIWGTPADEEGAQSTRSQAVPEAWQMLLADLDTAPPELIVDAAAAGLDRWAGHDLPRYPELWARVLRDYDLLGSAAGAMIYRLRSQPRSPAPTRGPGGV